MSLTHAEQLSSPVLKRVASRSASGWLTAFKLRRGRFASVSEAVHEPQRIAILLRPTALEWLGFCAKSCAHELHEQLSPPFRERYVFCTREATSESGLRRLYLLLRNACGCFRRRTFVLLGCRPCPSKLRERALRGSQSLRERQL